MNRTTQVILEYLSPKLAAEVMIRIHNSLPADPKERNAHLNEVHRELKEVQEKAHT
jgi:hypothetical protein